MKTALIVGAVLATAALAGTAAATPGDGMPGQSWFGLCTAWNAMGGNDNPGNAPNAPPFAWLQQQAEEADQTVAEWCAENAPHPGGNGNGNGGGNGNGNGGGNGSGNGNGP